MVDLFLSWWCADACFGLLLVLRWKRWAVYQRFGERNLFQYSLQDYIHQQMQLEIQSKARDSLLRNDSLSASIFNVMDTGLQATEREEVEAVVLAYYSALNRKNFEEVRAMWLPDDNSELLLPGQDKAVYTNAFI